MMPSGFQYGLNLVVEFEPYSLLYQTSLPIAASGLKSGARSQEIGGKSNTM
jgi:hypothetical protein